MKRIFSFLFTLLFLCPTLMTVKADDATETVLPAGKSGIELSTFTGEIDAVSAVLMDAETGTVLYAKNEDAALPPASVTKIMTMLLVMEAIDGGAFTMQDKVTVSPYAASMGGSQVYLSPGEEMCVEELIKCVMIASANDAAVALAEKVAGSEEAFVAAMNARASELGMKTAKFENVTGLDDDTVSHVLSAMDIAIMSKELLKHKDILRYTGIWMDSIRNGAFGLTNTNRLIRFYPGATGLKTGSTAKAGFCISATAQRDGLHLIAVIMGAKTRDSRNAAAQKLLDFGFAHYAAYRSEEGEGGPLPVHGGTEETVPTAYPSYCLLVPKGKEKKIERIVLPNEDLQAPIRKGDVVGKVVYRLDGETVGECDLTASEDVSEIGFFDLLRKIFYASFMK